VLPPPDYVQIWALIALASWSIKRAPSLKSHVGRHSVYHYHIVVMYNVFSLKIIKDAATYRKTAVTSAVFGASVARVVMDVKKA